MRVPTAADVKIPSSRVQGGNGRAGAQASRQLHGRTLHKNMFAHSRRGQGVPAVLSASQEASSEVEIRVSFRV